MFCEYMVNNNHLTGALEVIGIQREGSSEKNVMFPAKKKRKKAFG